MQLQESMQYQRRLLPCPSILETVKKLDINEKRKLVDDVLKTGKELAKNDIFFFIDFFNIGNEKGETLEFKGHKYLIPLLKDSSQIIIVKKSAQVGITQTFLVKILHNCYKKNMSFIYTLPTESDVYQFSQARFNPILWNSGLEKKSIDNAGLKFIERGTIYFKGTYTEREALSIPADCLCIDELDFSRQDVISMYDKRLGASKYKWKWLFSTPTLPDYGIDVWFKESTQTIFLVKCNHCNKEQELSYFENVIGDSVEEAKFVCSSCKEEIDRNNGNWVDKYPGRNMKGYHITKLISPLVSAGDLKLAEENARRDNKLKYFYNFDLGECYSSGISILNREIILRQFRNDEMEMVGQNCYMGVDQGDELHIEISRQEGENRKIIYVEKTLSFDRVGQLMEVFGVKVCCIDALPNKHSAKKLRDDFKGRVYLVYYGESDEYFKSSGEDYSITVDRNESLDRSVNSYISGETIVCNLKELKNEFIFQMGNLKKDRIENKHGEAREVWVRVGLDHFRHADNYNYLAFQMTPKKKDVVISMGNKVVSSSDNLEIKTQIIGRKYPVNLPDFFGSLQR